MALVVMLAVSSAARGITSSGITPKTIAGAAMINVASDVASAVSDSWRRQPRGEATQATLQLA